MFTIALMNFFVTLTPTQGKFAPIALLSPRSSYYIYRKVYCRFSCRHMYRGFFFSPIDAANSWMAVLMGWCRK
jgi:hypothetical protein